MKEQMGFQVPLNNRSGLMGSESNNSKRMYVEGGDSTSFSGREKKMLWKMQELFLQTQSGLSRLGATQMLGCMKSHREKQGALSFSRIKYI